MINNINNLGNKSPVKQQTAQQTQVKQQVNQADLHANQSKKVSQDSVSLTPQAKQLNDLQKKANDASEVNQKKVEQLKKVIQSGNYKVDPEKLAENITRFELEL